MNKIVLFGIVILLWAGCAEKYTPKPRGYYRIDFPEKAYHKLNDSYPYSFEIPVYSHIEPDRFNPDQPYWINIAVPENQAEVHISYYNLNGSDNSKVQLSELTEETYRLAYKHSIRADGIEEQLFMNPEKDVYGILYRIKGNAASPYQFFLTDSTRHFLRGAFYIRETPNIDSLQPVIRFFEPDVIHLMETANWN